MTLVRLELLHPNPWRNLTSYPIDDDDVEALKKSIHKHGFFGGIKARPDGNGGYQLGFGHHRIAAAKKAGLEKVDIGISDIDDDTMIQLMCVENATQHGSRAAAVLNEVEAVVRRLTTILHENERLGRTHPSLLRSVFPSDHSFAQAKRSLLNGDGIGKYLIRRYLGSGDEKTCPRNLIQIQEAIASLKQTGTYEQILRDVGVVSEDEPENETGTETTTETETPTETGRHRHQRIYDERCVSVFPTESQANAFRTAVTTSSARRFINVSDQLPLARKIVRELNRTSDANDVQGTGRRGAPFVKSYVSGVVREAITAQNQINQQERQQLMLQQREGELESRLRDMAIHMGSLARGYVLLDRLLTEDPGLRQNGRLPRFVDRSQSLLLAIKQFNQSQTRRR